VGETEGTECKKWGKLDKGILMAHVKRKFCLTLVSLPKGTNFILRVFHPQCPHACKTAHLQD